MEKKKATIELSLEEVRMVMAGLNYAACRCYERDCPDVAHEYSSVWCRFYELEQDICHD